MRSLRVVLSICLLVPVVAGAQRRAGADTSPLVAMIDAPGVSPKPMRVRVYLPPGYRSDTIPGYPVLYANDGQDMEAVGLQSTLTDLYRHHEIRPMIVVAIDMPQDRMAGYGVSDRAKGVSVAAPTKYGAVGANAQAYSQWLAATLVPYIDARWNTRRAADSRWLLGWSLGAINAFSVGWQYPEIFGKVGAFSPSFWLSTDSSDAHAVQATRIANALVESTPPARHSRFFFAAGDAEEKNDRDGDGIIDVIDDVLDLMQGWKDAAGVQHKGLAQLGYSINTDYSAHPDRSAAVFYSLRGGEHNQKSWARMLPAFLQWVDGTHAPPITATGAIESWQDMPSRYVAPRNVDVWLPPDYALHPHRRYPVVYMHDGQNLFDPALVFNHFDWDIDGAMTRLIAQGKVRPAIVVGIWNTPRRFEEYMPERAVQGELVTTGVPQYPPLPRASLQSEAYLRFVVTELKPFIDRHYRTRRGRSDTTMMGSSMGGLISLYALARYPNVFGSVAGVSTHWPAGDGAMVDWFGRHLPDPRTHRIWMDHGDATLDAGYAPYQREVDAWMRRSGYVEGRNWTSRTYRGAEHSEKDWRLRVPNVLEFLLGWPRR